MPFVHIDLIAGRTPEVIEKLIAEVIATVSQTLESPPEKIRVVINEVPASHWGIAGVSANKFVK
ncbi:4-oxalocrotonate tautomerase [Enterococcus sp. LJL90]